MKICESGNYSEANQFVVLVSGFIVVLEPLKTKHLLSIDLTLAQSNPTLFMVETVLKCAKNISREDIENLKYKDTVKLSEWVTRQLK